MANQKQVAMLKEQGVDVWNQWIEGDDTLDADLTRADLSGLNSGRANLLNSDNSTVPLSEARTPKVAYTGVEEAAIPSRCAE